MYTENRARSASIIRDENVFLKVNRALRSCDT